MLYRIVAGLIYKESALLIINRMDESMKIIDKAEVMYKDVTTITFNTILLLIIIVAIILLIEKIRREK